MITDSSTFIILRDTDSLPIQRYSIAHEIGHILLGHNHTENITRSDEDETERFAIDLLAPRRAWVLSKILCKSKTNKAKDGMQGKQVLRFPLNSQTSAG